jgi:hypothetical protein
MLEAKRGRGRPPKGTVVLTEEQKSRRTYITAPRVIDNGIKCAHCGHCFDHKITYTYPNGNRRRTCGKCGKPFMTIRAKEND